MGKTAQIGCAAMDYGDPSGDVYMILTVLDHRGPYIRLARHPADPVAGSPDDSRMVVGNSGNWRGLALTRAIRIRRTGSLIFTRRRAEKGSLTPNQGRHGKGWLNAC